MKIDSAVRGKVLIVEDEPAIARLCQVILGRNSFEVEIASNGDIAKKKLQNCDYDLILIDIRLPVMDGRQLYQFLVRKRPELSDRVIFTTGDYADKAITHFIKSTGSRLLAKPFDKEELLARVNAVLHRAKAARTTPC